MPFRWSSAGRCAPTSGSCAAVRLQLSALGSCEPEGRRCWRCSSICRPDPEPGELFGSDPRARCSCASVLEQCHPGDPAPDLCGDLPAGRRSLSGDHPLEPAQHVGGLCVCFCVRRCAPFWPSPARFAAGVGSSMPSSASRRCASFWAPSSAFLSSGRMHERDLWPYLPRCGRSGAAVRVLRRWRLSYIPRRDQMAVRHLRAL